jgi:ArsR family transcriptional regulator
VEIARRELSTKLTIDQTQIATISKALADPTRLQIFQRISSRKNKDKEMFCGQIVEECKLTPGTISHHLKILSDANLISTRREGQFIYLQPRPETLREYTRALTKLASKK